MENLLICAYHKLKITHGILKVSFDLEQSSHINRNLRNFPGVCILNQDENIPVQTFPFNRTADNFYFFPYYTSKRTLAFTNRQREKYDGMDIVFKEFLSVFLYRIAKPYWKRKHICLVCEKFSSMAQDNGYYFFAMQ